MATSVHRFCGSRTGRIASVTPSRSYDAFATKATGAAKILLGGGSTTVTVPHSTVDGTSTTTLVSPSETGS